jgi:hypothetical protein
MSPDRFTDRQLDDLAAELAAAGAGAREADPESRLDPAFMVQLLENLRSEARADGGRRLSGWMPAIKFPRFRLAAAAFTVGAIAMAALLAVGWQAPSASAATADDAHSSTLVRNGVAGPLSAGTSLAQGDEIRVAREGFARLRIHGAYVRLAGGADVRIVALSSLETALDQVAGRVYYRVPAPDGAYRVSTGAVTWTSGGVLDLDRTAGPGAGDEVRALALFQSAALRGPGLDRDLPEGTGVDLHLDSRGSPADVQSAPISPSALAGGWLSENAALDAELRLPLGRLAALASQATQTATNVGPGQTGALSSATVWPWASPSAAGGAAASPTSQPSPSPSAPQLASQPPATTHAPTHQPTIAPPPSIAALGALAILDNPDATLTFSWTGYAGPGIESYELVYEPTSSGRMPSHLAGSPTWASPAPGKTSVTVAGIGPGDYQVRIQAVGHVGGVPYVLAETTVAHVHLSAAHPSPAPTATP